MGLIRVVFLVLDSHFVAAFQVGNIEIAEGLKEGLGSDLVVLNFLKPSLIISEEGDVIIIDCLLVFVLLRLDIVVIMSIPLECALQALHDSVL